MTDQEKVIKGLECCSSGNMCKEKCPYDELGCEWTDCVRPLAKDALSLLKAQEIPNNGGWISVQDRLPNNGQDVLAYLDDGEETRVAPCNYANGVWFDCMMNCVVTLHHITHWMSLSEPPKEE